MKGLKRSDQLTYIEMFKEANKQVCRFSFNNLNFYYPIPSFFLPRPYFPTLALVYTHLLHVPFILTTLLPSLSPRPPSLNPQPSLGGISLLKS